MLYRYPTEGQIAGVCVGIARYFALSTTTVRLICLILLLLGGFFIIPLLYCIAMIFLPKAPEQYAPIDLKSPFAQMQQNHSRLTKLQQEFDQLAQRISKIEQFSQSNSKQK